MRILTAFCAVRSPARQALGDKARFLFLCDAAPRFARSFCTYSAVKKLCVQARWRGAILMLGGDNRHEAAQRTFLD